MLRRVIIQPETSFPTAYNEVSNRRQEAKNGKKVQKKNKIKSERKKKRKLKSNKDFYGENDEQEIVKSVSLLAIIGNDVESYRQKWNVTMRTHVTIFLNQLNHFDFSAIFCVSIFSIRYEAN